MPAFTRNDFSSDFDIDQATANTDVIIKISPRYSDYFDATFNILPRFTIHYDTTFQVFPRLTEYDGSSDAVFEVYAGKRPGNFDKQFKILPRYTLHDEQLFQIYVHWREPQEQLFSVNVNYPDPYASKGTILDILINILKLLKDSWSLTEITHPGLGASSIAFSTGWYNESIAMPQITITPLASTKGVMSCGSDPLYGYTNYVNIDIWVRPLQDSGRSIGQAKWAEYNIRREVERILRSGSRIGSQYNNEEFIYFGKRSHRDEIDKRPVLFRTTIQVIDNLFRETYGDE